MEVGNPSRLYITEESLDPGSGNVVDDEDDEGYEEEQEEEPDDVPFVVVPDDVLEGFPGRKKKVERSLRTTE